MRSSSNNKLIRGGTVVTASETTQADIWVQGESIVAIGNNLTSLFESQAPDGLVMDAEGCYVFPGGIDPHTHMELPFMGTYASDDFETGTRAGLYGGTTTIIDFAIQTQGKSLRDALETWYAKAAGKALGDYAFHVGVTDFNPETRAEIKDIIQKDGISSFKVFMAYKGALMVDDRQILQLMDEAGQYGGAVIAHCENGDMIDERVQKYRSQGKTEPKYHALAHPEIAEAEASGRFIDLAYQGGHPCYIVHLTCEGALNRVREASRRNQTVFTETCIQYLLLDDTLYERPGFEGAQWVFSPPLRKPKDQAALWAGIDQGLIHTVATDHCPFCLEQKRMGEKDFSKIPNGAPGIEHRMELLYSEGVRTGKISLNQFVALTSTQAAKLFGLLPKKGTLSVGADADIVIFDPTEKHTISAKTHHHQCDYSAYEGWQLTGKTRTVLLRGHIAVDRGECFLEPGYGKYLPRAAFHSTDFPSQKFAEKPLMAGANR
ncbi:MAG: dihydropyrimidinase [Cyanobacteria bacterium]|nr:dihydropyrimidinase [Cyanobacteriota bacterium]